VHQSFIPPNLKPGPHTRRVHAACGLDCFGIVLMLDVPS